MKNFLITITSLIFLSACSYQNAFSKFEMTEKDELLASNTQSSKIEKEVIVQGVFTAVYLNNVSDEYADSYENFLVGVYLKDSTQKYDFVLNKQLPINAVKIKDLEKYSELLKNPRKWDIYYFVQFEDSGRKINFTLENDTLSSAVLRFLKDPL